MESPSGHSKAPSETIPEGLPVPGDLVAGKLRIERVIGRGGMGVVYAAHHQSLDKRVALKFVLPELTNRGDAVRRFMKEARAGARIRGEHVGQVLDVAELPGGAPYIVMEYLEGEDLGALLLREGPLPIAKAIDFALQACEALGQAHAAQIVHRDIKPSNLFLCAGGRLIKVLDFGISKIDEPASSPDGRLTASTTIIGSPSYMAPEQLRASREVDGRADIWSLGVVLYELLSGELPFQAGSLIDLGVRVMTAPTPSVRIHRPEVPPDLDAAIQRCLAKAPGDRFDDVGELALSIATFGPRGARGVAQTIAASLTGMARGDHGAEEEDETVLLPLGPGPVGASALGQPLPIATPMMVPVAAAPTPAPGTSVPTLHPAARDGGTKNIVLAIAIALASVAIVVGLTLTRRHIAATRPPTTPVPATTASAAPPLDDKPEPPPPVSAEPPAPPASVSSEPVASPSVTSARPALPTGKGRVRPVPSTSVAPPTSATPPPSPSASPSGIALDRHG